MSDVTIWLDTTGGFGKQRQISPNDLRMLEYKVVNRFNTMLYKLGQAILQELIWGWQQEIHSRPRTDQEYLQPKLLKALDMRVGRNAEELWVGIFDLASVDRATRNEGAHTGEGGWFLLFEDGHKGRAHGSSHYQFVGIKRAMELADECCEQMQLEPDERAEFLVEVRDAFAGKHGEGIMVNLNEPLFFKYPQFGGNDGKETPARVVLGNKGNPGFEAWNVIEKTMQRFKRGDRANFLEALIMEAAAAAAKDL